MKINKSLQGLYLCLLFCLFIAACGDKEEQSTTASPAKTGIAEETPKQEQVVTDQVDEVDLPPHQQMAKDFLKELVEIDTTHSTGSATLAAKAMARRLLDAGFDKADVQVLQPVDTKGNLVARYRGKNTGRQPLLLLALFPVKAYEAKLS